MDTTISSSAAQAKPKAVARGDKHIWGILIALCLVSIVELYSASSREVAASSIGVMGPILRHLIMLGCGLGVVWYVSRRHYSDMALFTIVFAAISFGAMFYVFFWGDVINGARRSMSLLGIGIFPAEMVKISAVLMVALIMTLNQNPYGIGITGKGVMWCGCVIVAYSILLFPQGLTNTALLIAITYSMMIIGGVKIKHMLYLSLFFAVMGGLVVGYLYITEIKMVSPEDAPKSRLATWIARSNRHRENAANPWEIPATGDNRQEVLGYMAQAHGGLTGVGPGNSREAARLPLAFSDYIFAIVIEELGLIGGLAVLMLYLWLLGRAASIASRCTATYPALLVMGMAVMIAFQALFHAGIVAGTFPVSGQPLPLISKGGTSIMVTCIAFGIMLSVSRTATSKANKKQEIRDELDSLPEQLNSENKMQL